MVMLFCDDPHPEMLKEGNINKLIGRLISEGYNEFDVIRSATIKPSEHYKMDGELLSPGHIEDFILVDSLGKMKVLETWINGKKVFEDG
jgi:adenine deaminase